jgi:hypothetical protein
MARSGEFYQKLGFELLYGGESATVSSLKAGEAFVNLSANPGYQHRWWGRVVYRCRRFGTVVKTHPRLGARRPASGHGLW